MSDFGKTVLKLAVGAAAAYGVYCLYKNYIKKPQVERDFDDVDLGSIAVNEDAAKEETLAAKIMAAAQNQLNKIK